MPISVSSWSEIYNSDRKGRVDLAEFSDEEVLTMAQNLEQGVPMATPVFDGASEQRNQASARARAIAAKRPDHFCTTVVPAIRLNAR